MCCVVPWFLFQVIIIDEILKFFSRNPSGNLYLIMLNNYIFLCFINNCKKCHFIGALVSFQSFVQEMMEKTKMLFPLFFAQIFKKRKSKIKTMCYFFPLLKVPVFKVENCRIVVSFSLLKKDISVGTFCTVLCHDGICIVYRIYWCNHLYKKYFPYCLYHNNSYGFRFEVEIMV